MIRIFADFNGQDRSGRVRLNCARSLREIAALASPLRAAQTVWLYDEEAGVEAELQYDAQHEIWLASPRWDTWRDSPTPAVPVQESLDLPAAMPAPARNSRDAD